MKSEIVPNIEELNAVLIFSGFPIFTQIVYGQGDSEMDYGEQGATLSIIYRAFCLSLSLYIIISNYRNRNHKKSISILKWTFFLFCLMSIKLLYSFFLAPYSFLWTKSVIITKLSFLFGVTLIPIYALYLSFNKINWNKVVFLITLSLLIVCSSTLLSISDDNTRLDLNSHQSTLAFGAYSAYLVIISTCLFREFRNIIPQLLVYFIFIIGAIGLLKAGSRGPLLGAVMSLLPLFLLKKGYKIYLIAILIIIPLFGSSILSMLEDFSPVIFSRLTGVITQDESTMERINAFLLAIKQMNEYPIIGESPLFYTNWAFGFGPHNLLLQIGMGLGYIGLLFSCFLFYKYLTKAIRNINGDAISSIFSALMIFFLIRSQTGIDIYEASDMGMVIVVLYMYNSSKINDYKSKEDNNKKVKEDKNSDIENNILKEQDNILSTT